MKVLTQVRLVHIYTTQQYASHVMLDMTQASEQGHVKHEQTPCCCKAYASECAALVSPSLECARLGLHEWLNIDSTGYMPSPVSELVSSR